MLPTDFMWLKTAHPPAPRPGLLGAARVPLLFWRDARVLHNYAAPAVGGRLAALAVAVPEAGAPGRGGLKEERKEGGWRPPSVYYVWTAPNLTQGKKAGDFPGSRTGRRTPGPADFALSPTRVGTHLASVPACDSRGDLHEWQKCNFRSYLPQACQCARKWGRRRRMRANAMARMVFTFDTTHHALWAEEVAEARGIPADVVPAPPAAHARCSLALETLPEDVANLAAALDEEGVPFGRWNADDGA